MAPRSSHARVGTSRISDMAEKFTDIEMKLVEQPLSAKRQSFVHQHVKHSLEYSSKMSEHVSGKQRRDTKGDDEDASKLNAPCTWHPLEDWKYSPYIKRFFRLTALVNILSLAVNGPTYPSEYLKTRSHCEDTDPKRLHFIVLLTVDVILSILYSIQLFFRVQNSRHWHNLRSQKVCKHK